MHYVSLSLALSVCLSVFLSVCLSVYLSAHLSITLSISGYWLLSPHTRSLILTKQPKTTRAVRSSAFACVCIRVSTCTIILMHICACSCVSVSSCLCQCASVLIFDGCLFYVCMYAGMCLQTWTYILFSHMLAFNDSDVYRCTFPRILPVFAQKSATQQIKNKPPSSATSTYRAPIWHSAAL